MKTVNLEIKFTEKGKPFIRCYQAVMLDKEFETNELLKHTSEKEALDEARIFKDMGYTFLYIKKDIIFI